MTTDLNDLNDWLTKSRAQPCVTHYRPNADGWCPGAPRIIHEDNGDLLAGMWWKRKIGYYKHMVLECKETGGKRTLDTRYRFTGPEASDNVIRSCVDVNVLNKQ